MSNETEWVLVPREPSAGMWDSAENAIIESECAYNAGKQDARSDAHGFPTMRIWQAVVGYRAMLAAAPQPPAEAQAVAWMTHHDEPMLFPTRTEAAAYCDPSERPIPLFTAPPRPEASAPVGVEAGWYRYNKPAPRWEDTKFGKWLDPAVYGPPREQHGYSLEVAPLAQQPAADGGFTAADMMDARQEGRKEAQQPAAVDGALRAEVKGNQIAVEQLLARAERLAEALRELVVDMERAQANMRNAAKTDPRWEGCAEAIQPRVDAARAALRDHDQEGGNP